jgi:hypothetical protein
MQSMQFLVKSWWYHVLWAEKEWNPYVMFKHRVTKELESDLSGRQSGACLIICDISHVWHKHQSLLQVILTRHSNCKIVCL